MGGGCICSRLPEVAGDGDAAGPGGVDAGAGGEGAGGEVGGAALEEEAAALETARGGELRVEEAGPLRLELLLGLRGRGGGAAVRPGKARVWGRRGEGGGGGGGERRGGGRGGGCGRPPSAGRAPRRRPRAPSRAAAAAGEGSPRWGPWGNLVGRERAAS